MFLLVAGMNMTPVSRLKKTWSKAKTAKFFILEVNTVPSFTLEACRVAETPRLTIYHFLFQHQMDPTGNFYNYRTALRGAAHRSQTANSNRERVRI